VEVRKKQAEQARDALADFTLRAPFDGIPLRVQVSVGEALGANPREPAIEFCPVGDRIIRGELEQEFAARAKEGQKVVVEDYATGGERWEGRVKRKADWYTQRRTLIPDPMQYNDVRTLECIVELTLAKGQKPPRIGQRVTIKHTPDQD
jgi:multidrug resistance efflux pump